MAPRWAEKKKVNMFFTKSEVAAIVWAWSEAVLQGSGGAQGGREERTSTTTLEFT